VESDPVGPRAERGGQARDDMARDHSTAAYLHEFIEPQVRRHGDEHAALRSRLDELTRSYENLSESHKELRATCAAQEQRVAGLDARFTNIAGMWTRENHPGKQTGRQSPP
jgi:Ni,Fe-hydrogenase III large subunit